MAAPQPAAVTADAKASPAKPAAATPAHAMTHAAGGAGSSTAVTIGPVPSAAAATAASDSKSAPATAAGAGAGTAPSTSTPAIAAAVAAAADAKAAAVLALKAGAIPAAVAAMAPGSCSAATGIAAPKWDGSETGVVYDPRVVLHRANYAHVESPERASGIWQKLCDTQVVPRCVHVPAPLATDEQLLKCHPQLHVSRISATATEAYGEPEPDSETEGDTAVYPDAKFFDADTYYNAHSNTAARLSCGGLIRLCEHVLALGPAADAAAAGNTGSNAAGGAPVAAAGSGTGAVAAASNDIKTSAAAAAGAAAGADSAARSGGGAKALRNGFAVIRPPGHHADVTKAQGFCLFNNVAVAAKYLRAAYPESVRRVLIVDWDVHHGNGTQNVFYGDKSVLYFSIHRYQDAQFYPMTGHPQDTGAKGAEGFNINVPLNVKGLGDREYLTAWDQVLLPVTRAFAPDLLLISAGFDCACGDPLGGMEVSSECFAHLTAKLMSVCPKVVMALEGGYNVRAIADAVHSCMGALLGDPLPPLPEPTANMSKKELILYRDRYALFLNDLQRVIRLHTPFWPVLKPVAEDELVAALSKLTIQSKPNAADGGGDKKVKPRPVLSGDKKKSGDKKTGAAAAAAAAKKAAAGKSSAAKPAAAPANAAAAAAGASVSAAPAAATPAAAVSPKAAAAGAAAKPASPAAAAAAATKPASS